MVWDWGHRVYGALVLPRLDDTLHALFAMIRDGRVAPALAETASHALAGWLGGAGAGLLVGTFAGLSDRARAALQPVAIIFLGIPTIAWVVIALLWFGGGWAVVFTIAVATGPLVFAAAVEGARALDGGLSRMAEVYQVPFGAARRGASGSADTWPTSACRQRLRPNIRASFRAVCASGLRSHAPWRCGLTFCFATSPSARLTAGRARRCAGCFSPVTRAKG